jgi:hypothetical protein
MKYYPDFVKSDLTMALLTNTSTLTCQMNSGWRMDRCFLSMLKLFKKVFMSINMLHTRGI